MRFWDNPEAPLVDVYWYVTDLPFLPFPTIFNSRDWCEDPWHYTGRGEVFGARRTYDGMEFVPGLQPGHFCGTREDFEDGPAWPPTGEPLVYDPDGIPTCCRRAFVPQVTSGSRPAALVVAPTKYGRTSSGSRPAASVSAAFRVTSRTSSGSRPSSLVTHSGPYPALVSSGSYPEAILTTNLPQTGRTSSGSRPGALVGIGPPYLGRAESGSWPAAIVTPNTCPFQHQEFLGVDNPYDLEAFSPIYFYVDDLVGGHTYRVRSINPDPDAGITGGWRWFWGRACDHWHEFFHTAITPRCWEFVPPMSGRIVFSVLNDFVVPAAETWVLEDGPCT